MLAKRKLPRLNRYNYSQTGYYFVTICTKDKLFYFGEIRNNFMQLNNLGIVAEECWQEIPKHFANAEIDHFVVMPNHIHGVIHLSNTSIRNNRGCSEKNQKKESK